jgi:cytoskeleton protein RodZ
VVIHAREESWVEITADGKAIPSELLTAGSERTVRGQKEIVVKAGNAGGIDFRFNGKKLDTGGQYGEVKTAVFGPKGMLANAPAPP